MLVTSKGEPIEFIIAPGSYSDIRVFWKFNLDVPEGSKILADGAYNDYFLEDLLKESESIELYPQRKKNSKRPYENEFRKELRKKRKCVETAFSRITSSFPKTIRAVTPRGFEIKICLFILTYGIDRFLDTAL